MFVFNPNEPSKRIQIHVLFDTGSQCSYVTNDVCRGLCLNRLGTKFVSVITFGSKQEHVEHCSVVKIGFETKDSASLVLKLSSQLHTFCEPLLIHQLT